MDTPPQSRSARRKSIRTFVDTLGQRLHRRPSTSVPPSLDMERPHDRSLHARVLTRSGRATPSDTAQPRPYMLRPDELTQRLSPNPRAPLHTDRALPQTPLVSSPTMPAHPVKLDVPLTERNAISAPVSPAREDLPRGWDEPQAPGQFPGDNDDDEDEEKESWLSFLTQSIPFLSGWTWEGLHLGGNPHQPHHLHHPHFLQHLREEHASASESQRTDTEFPFIESEVEIETTPEAGEEARTGAKDDYFLYPTHRASKKRHWHTGTPLSHPFSRHRKSKHAKLPEAPPPKEDETWNLISAAETPIASADNGAPEFHPSAPSSRALSKKLQELDEVEINMFLQNFGRHTREVRLLGNTQHFARMPQWSDFAYSSDEDEEHGDEDATATHPDPHRRSRLLMHIDRGLQQLQPEGLPNAVPEQGTVPGGPDRLAKTTSCVLPSKGTSGFAVFCGDEREDNGRAELVHELYPDSPVIAPAVPRRAAEESAGDSQYHTYSTNEDTDAYESASNVMPEPKRRKRPRAERGVREDRVDGVAFCIAYILAIIEQYAPNDLDEAPITEYRESRARSHLERLYIIAPFWEQLFHRLRELYCWQNPRRTAGAAMIYFVLWYTDMLPAAFFATLLYYVLQFRYMPPDESYLHQKVQQRMQRGIDANRLAERLKRRSRLDILDIYKRWQNTYGIASQVMTGDIADFHEKVKNILLWRNPRASRSTVAMLSALTAFTTVCSAHCVFKTFMFLLGFTFFALMPLQAHYPRYRRPLNPLWWLVLGSPTDAQYAVQLLRERHQRQQNWLQQYQASDSGASDSRKQAYDEPLSPSHMHEVRREELDASPVQDKRPLSNKRLGSFLCQHHGMPGHLVITPTHLYFSPLHIVGSGKHYLTRLDDIVGLRKTHSLRLWLWSSNGLKVSLRNRGSLQFQNMTHRDDAFNLLLTFGSEVWRKV